jgi:hypothetical protein
MRRSYELRESESRGSYPTGVWRTHGGDATSPKKAAKGKTENWREGSKTQKGAIMRPMDEQQQFDELNVNRRIKLAPKQVFETSLNDSYDPITNAMRRYPDLTQETAEAMTKDFGF